MSKPTKIVIVEDDINLGNLLRVMINASRDYVCTDVVDSYDGYISTVKTAQPDISIIDIDLSSEKNGIDIIKFINDNNIGTEVVVHTVHDDRETLFEALKAGAGGYILKGSTPLEFLTMLENMKKGEVPISPKIARRILAFFKDAHRRDYEPLSAREIEILGLADLGYSCKQIAAHTQISTHTVNTHLKQIYSKLRVNSRKEALVKAKKISIL